MRGYKKAGEEQGKHCKESISRNVGELLYHRKNRQMQKEDGQEKEHLQQETWTLLERECTLLKTHVSRLGMSKVPVKLRGPD